MSTDFGVLGHPVGHSLSPVMFEAAFFEYGMHDLKYELFDIDKEHLENFLRELPNMDSPISGLAVTIPYKETVKDWVDKLDEKAKIIGAVNTLVKVKEKTRVARATLNEKKSARANSKIQWKGFNTDWFGAKKALEEVTRLNGKRVVILGAGGAAAAIVYACIDAGARVTILNRTLDKAEELVTRFKNLPQAKDEKQALLQAGKLEDILHYPADILIHTTSIGMWPNVNVSLVPAEYFRRGMVVFDIVYNPLQTKLVKEAQASGCKIVPGYKMLLYQAEKQFELWFKKKAPVHVMEKALLDALRLVH